MAKIKIDIDEVLEMIVCGDSLRVITQTLGVSYSTLHDFLNKRPDHREKFLMALTVSANAINDKGEQALLDLTASSTPAAIAKAKELAHHYRWLSGKRNPRIYSDKLSGQLDISTTKKVIKVITPDQDPDETQTNPDDQDQSEC